LLLDTDDDGEEIIPEASISDPALIPKKMLCMHVYMSMQSMGMTIIGSYVKIIKLNGHGVKHVAIVMNFVDHVIILKDIIMPIHIPIYVNDRAN
jgi:nucleoside permease NupC